jgi:acyl-coenzyme A synthetase/AMP-(fatty) acid ligase
MCRMAGITYDDAVHAWAIFRAGYLPVFLALRISTPEVAFSLLEEAKAQVLVVAPEAVPVLEKIGAPVPVTAGESLKSLNVPRDAALPEKWQASSSEDLVAFYHSSGSTAGRPKLAPLTARWYHSQVHKARPLQWAIGSDDPGRPGVSMAL